MISKKQARSASKTYVERNIVFLFRQQCFFAFGHYTMTKNMYKNDKAPSHYIEMFRDYNGSVFFIIVFIFTFILFYFILFLSLNFWQLSSSPSILSTEWKKTY